MADLINTAILGVGVALLLILWGLRWKRNKKYYRNIATPPTVPFLGNVLDFRNTTDALHTFMRYTQEYGEVVRVRVGPFQTFLLITDYKLTEHILSSTTILDKTTSYRFIQPWLGSGLLTADGSKWKRHRRILNPAFHFKMLETFVSIFDNCSDVLVEKLQEVVGQDSVDVYPFVTLCSLDIICESTMYTKIDAQNDTNSDYVRSVKNMCRITMERSISPVEIYDFLFVFSKNYVTQKEAVRILHGKSNSVIVQRRQELANEAKEENENDDDELHVKKKKPFLDLLLKTTLSQEDIRQEVDTFMFAGHDTTSAAISFTLYNLAHHPDVQQRAYEEQLVVTDDNTRKPTFADLQDMKYLELVIKETLRLYPSVPLFGRKASQDFTFGGSTFRKGDSLLIFSFGIHRNPKYFQDPDKFLPSRFENTDGKLPYAYIPFSGGPRNCIGQKFALLEMKVVISKILRKFQLVPASPEHKLKLATETVLSSINGVKIKFLSRN